MKHKKLLLYGTIVVYLVALLYLHYVQLLPGYVSVGKYWSDNPEHFAFAMTGYVYSLVQVGFQWMYPVFGEMGLSFLQVLFHAITVLASYWLIRHLAPKSDKSNTLLLALVCCIVMPIYVIKRYWYFGSFSGTIYHNSTYTGMQPFAILTLICFFAMPDLLDPTVKISKVKYLLYVLFLTITTGFKSNFVFGFAPALLLFLIVDFIRTKGRNIPREVLIGVSVFPSIIICLLQASTLFSGGEGLVWMPFAFMKVWCGKYFVVDLIRSLLFPILVALFYFRKYCKQFWFRFTWIWFAVALLEVICLADIQRLNHGNLLWGVFIAIMVLFLISVSILCQEWKTLDRKVFWNKLRFSICSLALSAHVITGVVFFFMILTGRDARA